MLQPTHSCRQITTLNACRNMWRRLESKFLSRYVLTSNEREPL
jgi:hypothetical protein